MCSLWLQLCDAALSLNYFTVSQKCCAVVLTSAELLLTYVCSLCLLLITAHHQPLCPSTGSLPLTYLCTSDSFVVLHTLRFKPIVALAITHHKNSREIHNCRNSLHCNSTHAIVKVHQYWLSALLPA